MQAYTMPLAIKAAGGGCVEGLLVRYSTAPDLAGDIFTPETDLGVQDGQELSLLWHHNLDAAIKGPIGKGTVKTTPAGLWFQAWLNRRDDYEAYIYKMIALGKAGYSSGAYAPGVVRQPIPGARKSFRLVRWPIREGSITPIPCDFESTVSIKSLALKAGARHSAGDARDMQTIHDLSVAQGAMCAADRVKARLTRELDRLEREIALEHELALLEK